MLFQVSAAELLYFQGCKVLGYLKKGNFCSARDRNTPANTKQGELMHDTCLIDSGLKVQSILLSVQRTFTWGVVL